MPTSIPSFFRTPVSGSTGRSVTGTITRGDSTQYSIIDEVTEPPSDRDVPIEQAIQQLLKKLGILSKLMGIYMFDQHLYEQRSMSTFISSYLMPHITYEQYKKITDFVHHFNLYDTSVTPINIIFRTESITYTTYTTNPVIIW